MLFAGAGLFGDFETVIETTSSVRRHALLFARLLLLAPAVHALNRAEAQALLAASALLIVNAPPEAQILHGHRPIVPLMLFLNLEALVDFFGELVDVGERRAALDAVFVLAHATALQSERLGGLGGVGGVLLLLLLLLDRERLLRADCGVVALLRLLVELLLLLLLLGVDRLILSSTLLHFDATFAESFQLGLQVRVFEQDLVVDLEQNVVI